MNKLFTIIIFLFLIFLTPVAKIHATSMHINNARCITHYPFPNRIYNQSYVTNFLNELPKIQQNGFNCVWFFIPWMEFEPTIAPPTYNYTSLDNFRTILLHLRERGMEAILPLNYLGEGWSPTGVIQDRWMFDPTSFNEFRNHAIQMVDQTRGFDNVTFLLFNEAAVPFGAALTDFVIDGYFITYLQTVNSNLSYWNSYLQTNYTSWSQIQLVDFVGSPPYQDWIDYEARSRMSSLVTSMRATQNPSQKNGYHWNFTGTTYQNQLYSWNGNSPFDFQSFNVYPETTGVICPNYQTNPNACEQYVDRLVTFLTSLDQNKPVFMGELGMSTFTWNDTDIDRLIPPILSYVQRKNMGFSMWMWKDFDPNTTTHKEQAYFGVTDINGNPKRMLSTIKPYLVPIALGDGTGDGKATASDFFLWVANFTKLVLGPTNGDFDFTKYVDGKDYITWLTHFSLL